MIFQHEPYIIIYRRSFTLLCGLSLITLCTRMQTKAVLGSYIKRLGINRGSIFYASHYNTRSSQNGHNILFVKLRLGIWSLSDSYYNNDVLFLKRLWWSKIGSDLHYSNKIWMALFLKRIIIVIFKGNRVK